MELFSPEFFSALFAIVIIDLVLAGDNAIVIALAARNLPERLRFKAIAWGTVGAIAVRTAMTLIVVSLLKIPGLLLAGGAMLVWIAYKLLVDDSGEGHEVEAAQSFAGAMKTIVVADALMGLDNVLAVAGAAHGSFMLVVAGLLISVPIVIWGSQLILKFVERYPVIVYIGSGVLAWTAVKMMTSEPLVRDYLEALPFVTVLAYLVIIGGVLGAGFLRKHAAVRERVAAHVVISKSESPQYEENMDQVPRGPSKRKVLVPVDGSPNALNAVRHVIARYATDPGLEVHVLHVRASLPERVAKWLRRDQSASGQRESAEKALVAARGLLDEARVPYALHLEHGDAAQAISRAAHRLHVDHIAIGTARSFSLTRVVQDGLTSRVLQAAHVPVEVVPGDAISPLERFGLVFGAGAAVLALAYVVIE
ncbi:MAG: YjbE family putative metal transport protein [Rhodospirillaceae bacterium]